MSTQVYRSLPTVRIGGKKMRYIGHDVSSGLVHFPSAVNSCPGQLLFLGVDVLTGASNVLSQNYARIHTRYTKHGYTSKMELEGFKIEGIHCKQALWFYNIQGLFHVAFELGNLHFQKDCLQLLGDEWLKRYNDPPLQLTGTLKYDVNKCETLQQVHCLSSAEDLVTAPEVQQTTYEIIYRDQESVIKDEAENLLRNENCQNLTHANTDHGDPIASRNVIEVHELDGVPEERESGMDRMNNVGESLDNGIGVEGTDTTNVDDFDFNSIKFKNELSTFLHKIRCDFFSSVSFKRIQTVLDYLYYLERNKMEHSDDVLFQIMEAFLMQVKSDLNDENVPSLENNNFNIPKCKFILLYLISDWLGHEYQALESLIADKVYKFKQENIMTIDLLPTSENLIDTLFPSFMKLFIVNWCGFGESRKSAQNENRSNVVRDCEIGEDHCYNEPMRVVRNTNHPLVLLMLEFGSNSLISGIAHVVFSRLKAQNEAELQTSN